MLRVVEHYLHENGLPAYPGNGTPFGAIAGHSSESAEGEQALWDTLAWMVATAAQRGASYHEYHAWTPAKPDDYLVVKAVPHWLAAGSVGIGSSLALDDWARSCLTRSGNANDPNQGLYAVCIIGRSSAIRDVWSKDPRFIRPLHERLLQIRAEAVGWQELALDRIVEHFRINPTTRTDWGRLPANLTLEQRKASASVRTLWHSAVTDALGATRRPIPDQLPALTPEDPMTPTLHYVPQLWTVNDGGAELREQADLAAPVVARLDAGTVIFTVGEDQAAGPRWRLGVAGDPERLFYVRRSQLTPLPPTPRDPELYAGIATVVARRIGGKPAIPETDPAELTALQAALDSANQRTAEVKRVAIDKLGRQAEGARGLAEGAEAAATAINQL